MMNRDDTDPGPIDVEAFGSHARLRSGEESRAQTRAELEDAAGGARALDRVLRGRPPLSGVQQAAGDHSPKVTVRLTAHLDAALGVLAERQGRRRSAVIRDALEEYAQRHSA